MKSKDEYKHFIELSLKIYKDGKMTLDEAVEGIVEMHDKKFSWNSFFKGVWVGVILFVIVKQYIL